MRILMIAVNDPAGTAIAFAKALNRVTAHTCRLVTLELRYNFLFDKDLHLEWAGEEEIEELGALLRESDVLHFHMTADETLPLGPYDVRDFLPGKRIVHHHHGHPDFRGNPEKYRHKYAELGRRNLLVSTPDLLSFLPGATYLPNLVPQNDPRYLPMSGKPEAPCRICHSPTRKDLKNTDLFLEVCAGLTASGRAVDVRLIEQTAHAECLRIKRRCHILFDHLQGYYGLASLEALSQGLCVVAGLSEHTRTTVRERFQTEELPWFQSSVENLGQDLARLVDDPALRADLGARSRAFMEHVWTDGRVASMLDSFYASLS